MTVQSAQSVTVIFTTRVFATGVGTNADSLPAGTLYLNGTANGATVTVTNISTGLYKAAVTMPTLAIADRVDLEIAATVSAVSDTAVIWRDVKDIINDASGFVTANLNGDLTSTMKASVTTAATAATPTIAGYTGNTPQTGDAFARLGAPAGASVSADVAAVNAKTTNLPAAPASTTNITGGTITTVTNLTNAPTAGDLTATMKTSVTTAATAATPTAAAVTGSVGSVVGLTASNVGAIKTQTDKLTFTVTNQIDANAKSMNDTTIKGTGISSDLWRG